jgi:rare lipoprotein A
MRFAVPGEQMRLLTKSETFHAFRKSLPLLLLASLAGCSSTGSNYRYASAASSNGVDARYGVRPSPRVVADGEEVPKGGGNYMVGKPYKIAGQTYYPNEKPYAAVGTASWYGSDFHGRKTANGEVFDRESISAAHPTMPLPSYARVTNLRNSRSIVVRVNDRGPYHG